MVTKSRRQISQQVFGTYRKYENHSLIQTLLYEVRLSNFQKVTSVSHKWPASKRNAKEDIGGPFSSQKITISPGQWTSVSSDKTSGTWSEFSGPICAFARISEPTGSSFIPFRSDSYMNTNGTKGIAQSLPTNPLAGMGQFLGELRDLPKIPKIPISGWKSEARKFRSLARNGSNEYLNIQFGWLPFIKDIRDFVSTAKNASRLIAQYERNSGRHIRRRKTINSDSNTTVTRVGTSYGAPALPTGLYQTPGVLWKSVLTKSSTQFSGAFTYYLPKVDTHAGVLLRGEALASKLFGLRLTPHLLWQLAPWSWAADWVSSSGDVIRNWSAFQNDGLVMHYGYLSAVQSEVTEYKLKDMILVDGSTPEFSQTFSVVTKQRKGATPYGFGLSSSGFSAKQLSIIAALGISKSPRSSYL